MLDRISETSIEEVFRKIKDIESFLFRLVEQGGVATKSAGKSGKKGGGAKGMMDEEAEMREIDTVSLFLQDCHLRE